MVIRQPATNPIGRSILVKYISEKLFQDSVPNSHISERFVLPYEYTINRTD